MSAPVPVGSHALAARAAPSGSAEEQPLPEEEGGVRLTVLGGHEEQVHEEGVGVDADFQAPFSLRAAD